MLKFGPNIDTSTNPTVFLKMDVLLKKGWADFAIHYNLLKSEDYTLSFIYHENQSTFLVGILDANGIEISYPVTSNIDHQQELPKRPEEEEKEGADQDHNNPSSSTSPLPSLRPRRTEQGQQLSRKDSTFLLEPAKKTVKFDLSNKECSIQPRRKFRRKRKLRGKSKAEVLMRAKDFKSKDPSFIVPLQPTYVRAGFSMNVPFKFAKTYLGKSQDVILKVEDGRTWPVNFSYRQYRGCSKTAFGCGWKEFVQDNDLKVGDVCAFVLKKVSGVILFKVVIFDENGRANSPVLSSEEEEEESDQDVDEEENRSLQKLKRKMTNSGEYTTDEPAKKTGRFKLCAKRSDGIIGESVNRKKKQISTLSSTQNFKSRQPYFKVALQETHLQLYHMVCVRRRILETKYR
ncbi:hypothetical protein CsatB_024462 [Cannabis sativa]